MHDQPEGTEVETPKFLTFHPTPCTPWEGGGRGAQGARRLRCPSVPDPKAVASPSVPQVLEVLGTKGEAGVLAIQPPFLVPTTSVFLRVM